jgi:uncharacterized membrane protein YphA (DoxX/SURF4 family)
MTLKSLARAWNEFFFAPQSPVPIALFRILYALIVILDIALLKPDWQVWFGPRGVISLQTMQQMEPGTRINVFGVLPQTEFWTNAVFWAMLVGALFLLVGLFTRASSIVVFVLVASLHERNLFIVHSGDTMLRATGFFLMFTPAGAALSLDRLLNIWRGREGSVPQPRAPWAQRIIQIEMCLLYFTTFWNKSLGASWVDGTAVYYVQNLEQFHRFPMPSFLHSMPMVKLETWFTLAVEFALGTLVWIKELRYPILVLGLMLHMGLEYSMNVPMFQWIVLALYVTFVDPADLARAWAWVRRLVGARPVAFSARSQRAAEVLQAADVFGRLRLVEGAPAVESAPSVARAVLRLWLPARGDRRDAVAVGERRSRARA